MKQPKRGRRHKDAIERTKRDLLIIATHAFHRRGVSAGAREQELDIVIKRLYKLRKERMTPRAAIRQVAIDLGLNEQRIRKGVARKFNSASAARQRTAAETLTSESEVARVLAAQTLDTGELIPDD